MNSTSMEPNFPTDTTASGGLEVFIAGYEPDVQTSMRFGPDDLFVQGRAFLDRLFSGYENERVVYEDRDHVRIFDWRGYRYYAITRLANVADPVSGRTGLEVGAGFRLPTEVSENLESPSLTLSRWLNSTGRILGLGAARPYDPLDSIMSMLLEDRPSDLVTFSSIFASLASAVSVPSPRRRPWWRARKPRAKDQDVANNDRPIIVAPAAAQQLPNSVLKEVACVTADEHARSSGGRGVDTVVAINEASLLSEGGLDLIPSRGSYRRVQNVMIFTDS